MTRTVLLVTHPGRAEALSAARLVTARLRSAGIEVRVLEGEAGDPPPPGATPVPIDADPSGGCELLVVLGGDGTLLRGAGVARPACTPLLGVNLGHVGFLAEAEPDDLVATVDRIVDCKYDVEERMTLDVVVRVDGRVTHTDWALNDAVVEKASRERMLEVVIEVDGRPLSRWACDGVIGATPTGSTAYAFSAGGPVVWPEVEALLLVPISAHALFARPLVVGPSSTLAVEVLPGFEGAGVLTCDGRRSVDLPPGARIEMVRGAQPVLLARLQQAPFTDRLVAKFELPVEGWRGASERRARLAPGSATGA